MGDPLAAPPQTILLVDDEPDTTASIRSILESVLDVRVLEAHSGADALDQLRANNVDLLITDQNMPHMTGVELLKEAAEIRPSMLRAMLTSERDLDLAVHAINELRIVAFYPKPVDAERFSASVKRILGQKASEDLRESGMKQASRVFQHEATLSGTKTRSTPFFGSLSSEGSPPRTGEK